MVEVVVVVDGGKNGGAGSVGVTFNYQAGAGSMQ